MKKLTIDEINTVFREYGISDTAKVDEVHDFPLPNRLFSGISNNAGPLTNKTESIELFKLR